MKKKRQEGGGGDGTKDKEFIDKIIEDILYPAERVERRKRKNK